MTRPRLLTRIAVAGLMAALGVLPSGCPRPGTPIAPTTPTAQAVVLPKFEDVTERAGIRWVHNACRTGHKLLPETVGGGGGFLDYNGDGLQDILLINGAPLPGYHGPIPHFALYRNNGNGTFTDVTGAAGLDIAEYGMGAAVGDYDNDGWPDILITAVGHTHLMHNVHGRFVDVTRKAGVAVAGFTTAAAWLDVDGDGRLDLFVARYVEWTPQSDLPCGPVNARQYCAPYQYTGAPPALFRNRGDGTFEDISRKAGVLNHPSKTLAVVPYDFNGDGKIDLYLANDTEPDVLLMNHGGTFTDEALTDGVAVGTDGSPTGSMGADAATPFADGRTTLAVGTFAGQELSLFVAEPNHDAGGILFDNRKQEAGLAAPTGGMTTFGLAFADLNLDGWSDIMIANGHIDDEQQLTTGGKVISYRQRPQLFLNQGDGTFRDVAAAAGLATPIVGRGLAVGDYDNDGRPDLLLFENGGPVRLWHNVTPQRGDWLGLALEGTKSPRDGTGAMVTFSLVGDARTRTSCVTSARSYLSICDPRPLFAAPFGGSARVSIRWPSGATTSLTNLQRNAYLSVREP